MTIADRTAPRPGRVLLNILSNWGGLFFSVGLAFFLAPFIVHHLGNSAYGVWVLTRAIAGYMALMDLGVRGAVTRYFARFFARSEHDAVAQMTSSAMTIFVVMAGIAASVSLVLAIFVIDHFKIPAEYVGSARVVLVLAGFSVGITLIGGIYGGIVAGLQRFDILNTVEIVVGASSALVLFLALRLGYGIVTMAVIQFAGAVARTVAMAVFAQRLYPQLLIRLRLATPAYARMIFSFSMYSFAMQVSGNLIYYSDTTVIAAFLPIGLLVFFTIGGSLVEYTRMLVSGVSQVMSPLASAIDSREEPERLRQLLIDSATFSMMVVLPIAVTFLLRGESFIGLWMGPAYAPLGGRVLFVLTLPLLLHAGAYGTGGLLLGIGRHKLLAPLMVVEGLFNLALSIILVRRFGIVGVAWGTAIPNLISSVLFWPWFARHTFGIEPTRYVFTIWLRPAVAILPFAVLSYCIERFWNASNMFEFIIQVAACVPFAFAGFWPICVSADQRGRLRTIVRTKLASAFV